MYMSLCDAAGDVSRKSIALSTDWVVPLRSEERFGLTDQASDVASSSAVNLDSSGTRIIMNPPPPIPEENELRTPMQMQVATAASC